MKWGVDNSVELLFLVRTAGPFDNPFSGTQFDISSYVDGSESVQITRGRSDEFSAFQAGTISFTLRNNHREFDPTNASSPFLPILRPMRRLQVVALYNGVLVASLFVGYIDGWPQSWTHTTGQVQITAHDALGVMARALTSPSHGSFILDDPIHGRLDFGRLSGDLPEQQSGERVLTLLQLAGFTSGTDVVVDTGVTRVLGTDPSGNILSLIQEAEVAEAGFFFAYATGVIVFYDRHSRFLKPRTANVQMVLTDDDYSTLEVERNLTQVWNHIEFSRPDGEPQMVMDDQSLHDNGILSYSQEIPVLSDGETLGRAEFFMNRYSQPKDRPTAIDVKVRRNMLALFTKMAGIELLDRIQIKRTPLGIGTTNTFTGLVEQISHTITRAEWVTTLATSLIDVDDGAQFLILDDAVKGQLDNRTLAY